MTSHLASPQIVASLRLLAFAGLLAAASLATGCATDHVIAAPPGANDSVRPVPPLTPPATGIIDVAFVVAPDAEVVDFAGPWGVFEYANTDSAGGNPFHLFTVAESLDPVVCSGGMTIVPTHTFENAPQPTIIVVPAMGEPSAALLAWLRSAAAVPATELDGLAADRIRACPDPQRVLSYVGGRGKLPELFGEDRMRYAAAFYAASSSFVRHLARRDGGYGRLLVAIRAFAHEHAEYERLSGRPIDVLRREWMSEIGLDAANLPSSRVP